MHLFNIREIASALYTSDVLPSSQWLPHSLPVSTHKPCMGTAVLDLQTGGKFVTNNCPWSWYFARGIWCILIGNEKSTHYCKKVCGMNLILRHIFKTPNLWFIVLFKLNILHCLCIQLLPNLFSVQFNLNSLSL